jgi:hypothetical protein
MNRQTVTTRPSPKRRDVKRRSLNDRGPKFLIGLDLGQVRDYTALVIVERIFPEQANVPIQYHLRHLERYELGTPYPEIVEDVTDLLEEPNLAGHSSLVVDGTGVGVPVVDMFHLAGLPLVPI